MTLSCEAVWGTAGTGSSGSGDITTTLPARGDIAGQP